MVARPFISYAREDQKTAVRLYGDLKAAGTEPWLDLAELLPGHEWAPEIRRAMRAASHVVVLVSSNSVDKTGFVQNETREALELAASYPPDKIFLIPARLDSTSPKYEKLLQLHWVDLFPNYAEGLTKILAALGCLPPVSKSVGTSELTALEEDSETSGTVLTDSTLRRFFATNRLSLHVDHKIAGFTLSEAVTERGPNPLESQIDALYVAGIQTIEQLERALRTHRDIIVRWAEEWLGGQDGPIAQGTYITYLGYVIICRAGDFARLRRFLEASQIDSAEGRGAIAEQVMKAYTDVVEMVP
jgi:hypothetical protein